MKVGEVREIRRYPVKSMGGEELEEVDLATRGIPGDRVWAVRDEVRGGIHGAKRIPALMNLRASFVKSPDIEGSSPALITFPDGSTIETGDPSINERLSEAIDRSVTLWPILPAEALDHYRRGAPVHEDLEQELRAMFGRDPDEPLPDFSIFPPELIEFQSPPGFYFDAFPVNLLTHAFEDLAKDPKVMRSLVREFGGNLGVYATVETPGRIRAGDDVLLLSE